MTEVFIDGLLSATVTTPSVVGDYDGTAAGATYGAGSITWGGGDSNLRSAALTFAGDFDFQFTINDAEASLWTVGVYDVAENATFAPGDTGARGDMDAMTNSWFVTAASTTFSVYKGSGSVATFTGASGDVLKISRVGTVFSIYQGGVLKHTWASTSSATMRPVMCSTNGRGDITNMTWTVWQ